MPDSETFPSKRSSALDRLDAFLPGAPAYAKRRNHVLPGHPNVSRLSPAIRHRLLTEDEVIRATLETHPLSAVEKFVQEVTWRTYWKSWLELRPGVWQAYRSDLQSFSPETRATAQAALDGPSGIVVFDHFARELRDTGYLHNHARMWFAAIWIHTLRLPWQLGAEFFEHHLLDADPASNTLSWRWVAGLHTPGKTYLARRSNLEKFLDPEILESNRDGLNRLESPKAAPVAPEELDLAPVPPPARPFNDLKLEPPVGLWLHEDDLSVEHSELAGTRLAGCLAPLLPTGERAPLRQRHLENAFRDAAHRASTHFACPAEAVDTPLLADWATGLGIKTVVAPHPWTGQLNDLLPSVRSSLEERGIALETWRRRSDAAWEPLGTAGFFSFWKKTQKRGLV